MTMILERNGVENTSIDAARFNRFCANYRDGILKNSFSECSVSQISSNVIQVKKGELLISGFRVVLSETNFTFSSFPVNPTPYHIVAQIQLSETKQPEFKIFVQQFSALQKDNLFAENGSEGTYQIEIATFILGTQEITNLNQSIKIILDTADEANENSQKAVATSNDAKDLAQSAKTTAETAKTTAQEAVNKAKEAADAVVDGQGSIIKRDEEKLVSYDVSEIEKSLKDLGKKVSGLEEQEPTGKLYLHSIICTGRAMASVGYELCLILPTTISTPFKDMISLCDYIFDRHVPVVSNILMPASGTYYSGSTIPANKKGDIVAVIFSGQDNWIGFKYIDSSTGKVITTNTMTPQYVDNNGITYSVNVVDTVLTMS